MPVIPFLPKCRGRFLRGLDKAGVWRHDDSLLQNLPEDLDVQAHATKDALTGVPNIWARPLLFAMALKDDGHPLHNEVLGEWRGLLGISCLRRMFNFDVQFEHVDVERVPSNRFMRTIRDLIPDSGGGWDVVYLISVEGQLLGGTSPDSVVFARPEYELPETFPWRTERGLLGDPFDFLRDHGLGRETAVLKQWIQRAVGATDDLAIRGLLESWLHKIGATGDDQELHVGFAAVAPALLPPYDRLIVYADLESHTAGDFYLASTRQPQKDVLVIWPDGWRDQRRMICGSTAVGGVAGMQELLARRDKIAIVERLRQKGINCDVVFPETDFLAEGALQIPMNHGVLRCVDSRDLLPPFRPEVLNYFSPDDLQRMFHWENSPDGVTAVLTIPLRPDSKGHRQEAVLRKVYQPLVRTQPPVVAVWPDFRCDDWDWYYLASEQPGADDGLRFEALAAPSLVPGLQTAMTKGGSRSGCAITWSKKPIEAVECRADNRCVGLLLPAIKRVDAKPDDEWQVGVDFGTSNTTLAVKKADDAEPIPMVFVDRAVRLTMAQMATDVIDSWFMPVWTRGSLSSVYSVFDRAQAPTPVVQGVIRHLDPITNWAVMLNQEGVRTGLKWSMDSAADRNVVVAYLQQLVLLIAAEARDRGVTRMRMHASYPSAYPGPWQRNLIDDWVTRVTGFIDGRHSWSVSIDTNEGFATESEAVCRCIRGAPGYAAEISDRVPVCAMDIGGGTTDIGVWIRTGPYARLAAQASVLLAGNVLAEYAKANPDFLLNLLGRGGSVVAGFGDQFKDMLGDKTKHFLIPAAVNTLLKTHQEDILSGLRAAAPTDTDFGRIRSLILFAYGALFYYVGILMRWLATNESTKANGCSVFLAGNGPALLKWVPANVFASGTMSSFLALGAGTACSLSRDAVSIELPQAPKQEVALGLLSWEAFDKTAKPVKIIGESGYSFKGANLSWSRDMDTELVRDIFTPANVKEVAIPDDFVELENYIRAFNEEAEASGALSIEGYDGTVVRASMDDLLKNVATGKVDKELLQPFFIEEVRAVMRHYFLRAVHQRQP